MGTLVRRIASLKCKEVKHRMKREEIIIGGSQQWPDVEYLQVCRLDGTQLFLAVRHR